MYKQLGLVTTERLVIYPFDELLSTTADCYTGITRIVSAAISTSYSL